MAAGRAWFPFRPRSPRGARLAAAAKAGVGAFLTSTLTALMPIGSPFFPTTLESSRNALACTFSGSGTNFAWRASASPRP